MYDADGRLVSATDPSGRAVQLAYDAAGRVTSTADALGKTTSFTYDANGNNTSRTSAGRTTTSTFDPLNRVSSITTPSGRIHTFKYDASGNLVDRRTTRPAAGGGTRTVLSEQNFYDLANRLTRAYTRNGDGKTLSRLAYAYDAAGNPASRTTTSSSQTYAYDALDRLTSVDFGDHADQYAYDQAGNRTSKNAQPYTYDELNRMTSAPGGSTFQYDAQGRTASQTTPDGTTTYAYDSLDRLTAKAAPGTPALTFSYDALGRIAQTTGNALTRSYNYALDDRPLSESTQISGAVTNATRQKAYAYGPRGLLETQISDATPTYPALDEHGSVLASITESGTATDQRDYDPFGAELAAPAQPDPGEPLSPLGDESFGYLGGHARAGVYASDQIHMGARTYDPQSGRFLSRDPEPGAPALPQTQNAYAYGLNSPGRYYDLDGRFAEVLVCATPATIEACLIGGAIIVTGGVIVYTHEHSDDIADAIDNALENDGDVSKEPGSSDEGGGGSKEFKTPRSGSGKAKSTDIPSWVRNHPEGRPYEGESGKAFAKRMCDEKYGDGNYPKGGSSEYKKIQKWGDRAFD